MDNLPAKVTNLEPMRLVLSRTVRLGGRMRIDVVENGIPWPSPPLYDGTISFANLFFANLSSKMLSSKLWFKKETLDGGQYVQTTFEWIGGDIFNLKGR